MTGSAGWELAATAAGPALAVGVIGAIASWCARRRTIAVQASLVALVAVLAVAAGAVAAARAMFFSQHDLDALVVVLLAAGTIGMVVALELGRRVGEESRHLGEVTRRIGAGEPLGTFDRPVTGELARLAAHLEATSEELEAARARERALETSRRELVAWVSHDLRTPLAGIRAIAEALEDGVADDDETISRYHRTIRHEVETLTRLVDDLFELSRIQAGALQLQLERASLADVVSDAIAAADPLARRRGVRLEGRVGAAPELPISTPEVARLLRNLIENAVRHTPSDGSVFVDLVADEESAYVSVADECGGIPDDDLDRVFDLAFRGEAARTPGDGRAGLGLSIARGIAEAHDGHIAVANESRGCRFTVRLPLEPAR